MENRGPDQQNRRKTKSRRKTIDSYEIQGEIEDYEYYEKDPSITTDNYTRRNHGDFSMRVLPNTAEAKSLIECDRNSDVNSDTGNNEYNGYHHRFKKIASPAERVYDRNAIYLCPNKIYDNEWYRNKRWYGKFL